MVWTLQAMGDRHIARGEIDQPPGNEERRHPARAAVAQYQRGFGDAFDTADAGADHDTTDDLILVSARVPIGIVERLRRRTHGEDDEVVDLALFLRLHPVIGVEGAAGAVTTWDLAGDLAGDVGNFEFFDAPDAALSGKNPLPCRLDAAGKRGHHTETCDDDTSHHRHSREAARAGLSAAALLAHRPPAPNMVRLSPACVHVMQ